MIRRVKLSLAYKHVHFYIFYNALLLLYVHDVSGCDHDWKVCVHILCVLDVRTMTSQLCAEPAV